MNEPTFEDFRARLRAEPDPKVPERYGAYRSYSALFDRVEQLRARTDGEVAAIGRSAGGEPIWALRFGPADAPLRILYMANLHAQEFVGVEALLRTVERIAERCAAGDARYQAIEITCVPTANPDGYRQVVRDLAAGAARFRRKNRRNVDLNRNFAEGWDRRALLGRALSRIYEPGPSPLCEPETRALDQLFARRFHRALSFHSFGGWIFWPWAARRDATVDDRRLFEIAQAMQLAQRRPYRSCQLGRWSRWFRAGGAEIDHLYGRYGTLAFLMEVSHGGRALQRPRTWLDPFAWFNPRDVDGEAENAAQAALALVETALPK